MAPRALLLLLLVQLMVAFAQEDGELDYEYRLPTNVKPSHYEIRLRPYFDPVLDGDNFATFDGQVIVKLDVIEPTDELRLHSLDMIINSFKVRDAVTRKLLNVTYVKVEEETQQVVAGLNSSLEKGHQYVLTISYTGHLRNDNRGIAKTFFRDETTGDIRWVVFSSFEATHARRAFPCWDEPMYKAHFTVRIARRHGHKAVSTMPLMPVRGTVPVINEREWEWDSFVETPLLPPYVVSLAVGPWEAVNASAPGAVPGSCYVVPGRQGRARQAAAAIGSALRVAADAVIGIGLPPGLSKLDCVIVPDPNMDWAVENWGLLTFGESMAMLDEKHVDAASLQEVWATASHEVAHLWFGNLATLRWWSNLWLKEGFATYFQYAIVDQMRPDWQMWSRFGVDVTQSALREDVRGQRAALYADATTPAEIEDRYDEVSYHKGGAFIRMLESFLGRDVLLRGIRNFLEERLTDTAGVDLEDLFRAVGDVSDRLPPGQTLADVMTPWVTQPGFPLVTVSRQGGSLVLSQSQFRPENDSAGSHRWWVPVTYTCSPLEDNQPLIEGLVWLPPHENAIVPIDQTKCKWLIFNMGHKGYFRVNYARNVLQWRRLSSLLARDVEAVPAEGRAQLLDDAFSLTAAQLLDYRVALGLAASFLEKDTAPGPWAVATTYFGDILDRLRYRPGIMQIFSTFLRRLIRQPLLQSLQAGPEQHPLRLLKKSLSTWACMRLSMCPDSYSSPLPRREESLDELEVDPDLVGAIMCGAQRGPGPLAAIVRDALSREAAPPLHDQAISAVACSGNATVIYKFLKMSMDPEAINLTAINIVQSMDSVLSLPSQAAFDAAHRLVQEFMSKRSDAVSAFLAMMLSLAGAKNETDLALSLARNYPNDTVVTDTLEELEADQEWITKYARTIFQWLQDRRGREPKRSSNTHRRGSRRRLQSSRQKAVTGRPRVPRMVATGDESLDGDWEQNELTAAGASSEKQCNFNTGCGDMGGTELGEGSVPEGELNLSNPLLVRETEANRGTLSLNSLDNTESETGDPCVTLTRDCSHEKVTTKRGNSLRRRIRRQMPAPRKLLSLQNFLASTSTYSGETPSPTAVSVA
ncbi:uncharacterized protein LOC126183641 [Schistocerca cancellata]|uniref:uncharacterized protein LOC126183641 n=1 Tax=Schistocerca cancellata TaxID=274614 RepID=UPI0021195A42|nr:uncharacterized protein LOC126183641 [Schistocerca cancellata]